MYMEGLDYDDSLKYQNGGSSSGWKHLYFAIGVELLEERVIFKLICLLFLF